MEPHSSIGDTDQQGDDDLVMISALEHFAYCPRQCALIHVEQTFNENIYTLRGRFAHERPDTAMSRIEQGLRVERSLPLFSRRLGLTGRADVVEFRGATPLPVEYKLGKRRQWRFEAIQVCAQAMCLEEMLGVSVPTGAIYYVSSRERRDVLFDESLRRAVEDTTLGIRAMLCAERLPSAPNDQRCVKCSLLDSCLPNAIGSPGRLRYERAQLFRPLRLLDLTSAHGSADDEGE